MTPQAPRPLDKVNREFHASGPIALWVVDYVRSHLGELRLCCLDRRSSSPDRGLEGLLFNGSKLRPVGPAPHGLYKAEVIWRQGFLRCPWPMRPPN